ncbi:2'-5' RNA ligase family protein [Paraglaciecola sp.]|uniref:2'-5' RNA ligase family protein n=1 Tax=Paraglaciecola sp. TaxID=1920173 RepID=UPI003EF83060
MHDLYQQMWQRNLAAYQQQNIQIDKYLLDKTDSRRGITLLARLPKSVTEHVASFLSELKAICPGQYLYPESDMHLTIMSIVSCKQGYELDENIHATFLDVLTEHLTGLPSLSVSLSGITLSASGVLLTGYTDPVLLEGLRKRVRLAVSASGVDHSMDSRYKIKTAHSTVMRFKKPVEDMTSLIAFLKQNKHREFGQFDLLELELVFNDWYQSKSITQLIGTIGL